MSYVIRLGRNFISNWHESTTRRSLARVFNLENYARAYLEKCNSMWKQGAVIEAESDRSGEFAAILKEIAEKSKDELVVGSLPAQALTFHGTEYSTKIVECLSEKGIDICQWHGWGRSE